MGTRQIIRGAIGSYLTNGITQQAIPYLSSVWPQPPKMAMESDFYSAELPGEGYGAQIFVYIGETDRTRIAIGAKSPVNNQYGGRKFVVAQCSLLCYHRSTTSTAQDAGDANDEFIDGLIDWLEQDRNLGTAPGATYGGIVPTGSVFQAGEGGMYPSGRDLVVHALLPKPNNKYGTLTTFTSVEMKCCQIVDT